MVIILVTDNNTDHMFMDTHAVQCIVLWLIWLYILPFAFLFNEISLNFRLDEMTEIQAIMKYDSDFRPKEKNWIKG